VKKASRSPESIVPAKTSLPPIHMMDTIVAPISTVTTGKNITTKP